MDIKPCDGCDACQKADDGECVISDDMQILYPKLRDADAIVVASPIYWFTMSAQTKLCIDRWYALATPRCSALAGKQFAFVLTYGDSDPWTSGATNAIHTYQDMCRYLKAEIVGMVYGQASDEGDIEKQPKLLDKAYKLGQKLGASELGSRD
jgi:multimeric flavodoxin WrbA